MASQDYNEYKSEKLSLHSLNIVTLWPKQNMRYFTVIINFISMHEYFCKLTEMHLVYTQVQINDKLVVQIIVW